MTIKHLYPVVEPSLNLDFANSKKLDPRITFTRGSIGTYVGEDGLIKTAAQNEARFDHDSDGNSLGLLIEEARTNLVDNSIPIDFSTNEWRALNGTNTANSATSPDGSFTAAKFVSTSGQTDIRQYIPQTAVVSGNTYVVSVFVKANPYSYFLVGKTGVSDISGTQSSSMGARFDLNTGTTDGLGNTDSWIEDYGNGWYRCSVAFIANSNTNAFIIFYPKNSSYDSLTGDGVSGFYFWGGVIEEGSFPTSYIPTSGSTVTRAADVASLTNTNVYDTDSFTILNEPYGAAAGGSTLNIVGGGQTSVKRTTVYNQELSQSQINTLVKKDDEFWRWRILGSSFRLPNFTTDGQVTVDWGDGTVETMTTSEHTFTDGGGYHDVGFRLDSGTYFRPYINSNATYKDKLVSLGPAPESMKLYSERAFHNCTNLEAFDATVDASVGTNLNWAWQNCSSLTSFPLINTSGGTNFSYAWLNCSSLTSFPLLDTSSATNFTQTWQNCNSLTSFPLLDTSSVTNFSSAWSACSKLTSFPLIDTSSGTSFNGAWNGCSKLTSFPLIDTSSGTSFYLTWQNCTSLTSFPLIDTSSATNLSEAWRNCNSLTSFPLLDVSSATYFYRAWFSCSSLTTFPANFFDSWTGTPANNCFGGTWDNCSSLTATSVENILNSIDTSGQSAPASSVDITIDYDAGTGTPSVSTAVTNLKSRGWTITLNGVAQ